MSAARDVYQLVRELDAAVERVEEVGCSVRLNVVSIVYQLVRELNAAVERVEEVYHVVPEDTD